jgi:hypothetical protein
VTVRVGFKSKPSPQLSDSSRGGPGAGAGAGPTDGLPSELRRRRRSQASPGQARAWLRNERRRLLATLAGLGTVVTVCLTVTAAESVTGAACTERGSTCKGSFRSRKGTSLSVWPSLQLRDGRRAGGTVTQAAASLSDRLADSERGTVKLAATLRLARDCHRCRSVGPSLQLSDGRRAGER